MITGTEKIFIDTSALFILIAKNDKYHFKVIKTWGDFQTNEKYLLYTTNYIINEMLTLVQAKFNKKTAIKLGNTLLNSEMLTIGNIDVKLWQKGWEIFQNYRDKKFSFTDCTSFAYMKTNNIKKAFAFDNHFKQFGFELIQ